MANTALAIILSLIMQLPFNTVQDVNANIQNNSADYDLNQYTQQ